jgi:hypothetical protein
MAAGAFLFGGDLYIDRYVGGVLSGEIGPIEGVEFSIQTNVEVREVASRSHLRYGQIRETVNLPAPAEFSVTFADASPATLALALMGDVSALTQAAAAAVDYPVVAVLDKWVSTGKARFTGPVTVDDGAATTYVLGTDYLFNAELGIVKALSTGAITAAQNIVVNGATAAISGSLIQGGTTPDLRAKFRMDGRNLVDGAAVEVIVDEAIIAPSAAINFLSQEFLEMPLTGRMKTQPGQPSAFRVALRG